MAEAAYTISRQLPGTAEPVRLTMPHHYLAHLHQGSMWLTAQGWRWYLPPARAALVAADVPLLIERPGDVTILSAIFTPAFAPAPPAAPLAVFDLSSLARELLAACKPFDAAAPRTAHAEALLRALAATVWDLASRPGPTHLPAPKSPALAKALALTEAAAAGTPRFAAIAAGVGMTERTLARRFAAELGMSWGEALRRIRLLAATQRLAEGQQSIAEIAFAVGYESLSGFNAAFRAFTGASPGQYRRRSRL